MNPKDDPRDWKTGQCYPQDKLRMKIERLNEATGWPQPHSANIGPADGESGE